MKNVYYQEVGFDRKYESRIKYENYRRHQNKKDRG